MDDRDTLRIKELKLTLQHLGYVTNPVSAAYLVRLEGGLGVRLPSDYREFLLQIGYGAGPHKMWSPGKILAQPSDDLQMLLDTSESLHDLRAFCETDDVVSRVRSTGRTIFLFYHAVLNLNRYLIPIPSLKIA